MVLYEETYETHDTTDYTLHEKNTIGLGGITTVRLEKGEVIDLAEASVNYYTRKLYGKKLEDLKLGFETYHLKNEEIPLEDIEEVITEGFIITPMNRDNILKLIKEVKFTKIPQRD